MSTDPREILERLSERFHRHLAALLVECNARRDEHDPGWDPGAHIAAIRECWDAAARALREVVTQRDELLAAIQRLPHPPKLYGDGPDERVEFALLECDQLRDVLAAERERREAT